MKEVLEFLQENITGCLATVEEGKPRVRPFQFMLEDGGRLVFCTSNAKSVYRQLQANPYIEFSSSSPKFAWIRVNGKVEFCQDIALKEKVLAANSLVKSIYQQADNPIFEVFYLAHGTATLADFTGQPPKIVTF